MTDGTSSEATRNGTHRHGDAARPNGLYDLPLVGGLIERADRLRAGLPGGAFAQQEADFLRLQSRALHLVANALEVRAKQLERLERQERGEAPRIERVQID